MAQKNDYQRICALRQWVGEIDPRSVEHKKSLFLLPFPMNRSENIITLYLATDKVKTLVYAEKQFCKTFFDRFRD